MRVVILGLFILVMSGCDSIFVRTNINVTGVVNLQSPLEETGNLCLTINIERSELIKGEPSNDWQSVGNEILCEKVKILADGSYSANLFYSASFSSDYVLRISKISQIVLKTNNYQDELTPEGKYRYNTYEGSLVNDFIVSEPTIKKDSLDVEVSAEIAFKLNTFDFAKEFTFEQIVNGCSVLNSNTNKNFCIDKDIPPSVSLACKQYGVSGTAYSSSNELYCLEKYAYDN